MRLDRVVLWLGESLIWLDRVVLWLGESLIWLDRVVLWLGESLVWRDRVVLWLGEMQLLFQVAVSTSVWAGPFLRHARQVAGTLRPKIHGYTGYKRTGFVKPGSMKLAMGHLLHGEAAPWNRISQTHLPQVEQQVERSCWPSLCHCSPPSLDPVCSTLCSNCHTCLLARQWFYTIFFYDTCNAWCMVLRPWVDLIRCCLNQSNVYPSCHLTEKSWFTQ